MTMPPLSLPPSVLPPPNLSVYDSTVFLVYQNPSTKGHRLSFIVNPSILLRYLAQAFLSTKDKGLSTLKAMEDNYRLCFSLPFWEARDLSSPVGTDGLEPVRDILVRTVPHDSAEDARVCVEQLRAFYAEYNRLHPEAPIDDVVFRGRYVREYIELNN